MYTELVFNVRQVGVQVERDPSRLLRPTKGWAERQKDQTSSGGQVLHMPHRYVITFPRSLFKSNFTAAILIQDIDPRWT